MPDLNKRKARAAAAVYSVLVFCAITGRTEAQDLSPDRFIGTYRYAGGSGQRAAHARAIDEAASPLGGVMGPIARRVLTNRLPIPPRVVVGRCGDLVSIELPPWAPHRSRLDNAAARVETARGPATLRRRFVGGEIEERLTWPGYRRLLTFRLTGERLERLDVRWRVHAPRYLPAPVVYTLSYRRIGSS